MSTTPAPQHKTQECNRCSAAGFKNEPIYFEKLSQGPDGKIKWKVCNPDGSEHVHKGQKQGGSRPRYRVAELIEVAGVKEANAILMGNKMIDYLGHYYDAISNSVIYVLAKKEAVN